MGSSRGRGQGWGSRSGVKVLGGVNVWGSTSGSRSLGQGQGHDRWSQGHWVKVRVMIDGHKVGPMSGVKVRGVVKVRV